MKCPICQRHGWLTVAGLTHHLVTDHTVKVITETLAQLAATADPKPKRRTRCNKIPYPNEHAARVELVGTVVGRNRGKEKRRECRVYECTMPGCSAWHLTSQERKPA